MKNTKNAQKLKRIAKEKGKKSLDTAWKSKPLHGQYTLQSQKAEVYMTPISGWEVLDLRQTEGFIVAAQDQSLFTRNFRANILHNGAIPRCRFCNTSTKTIDHLISGCTILAPNEYTNRHNRVGQYIHWKICNHYNIETLTNGKSTNRYLLWIPQSWPFSGISPLELTEQNKLTDQI